MPSPYECRSPAPEDARDRWLQTMYFELRNTGICLEDYISSNDIDPAYLKPDEIKELDKAITVMKVGFKMVKKVLKAHGVKTSKTITQEEQA